jgi:pimeloyl-ACP methyl ester carboxylesterase
MFTRVCGAGRDLVLVHGVGVSGRYMRPVWRLLGEVGRAWLPDLPGFGRSWKPKSALGVDELSEALIAWMDAAGIDRAALIGNSMGCQVAIALAARYPARVEALVLVAPTIDGGARTRGRQLVRFALTALREPLALYPIVLADYLRAGIKRTWRTFGFAVDDRPEDKLAAIAVPTLVVRGARDRIVSQPWAERVAKALPRGRLLTLPRGGHAIPFDAPRDLFRATSVFLRIGWSHGARRC